MVLGRAPFCGAGEQRPRRDQQRDIKGLGELVQTAPWTDRNSLPPTEGRLHLLLLLSRRSLATPCGNQALTVPAIKKFLLLLLGKPPGKPVCYSLNGLSPPGPSQVAWGAHTGPRPFQEGTSIPDTRVCTKMPCGESPAQEEGADQKLPGTKRGPVRATVPGRDRALTQPAASCPPPVTVPPAPTGAQGPWPGA